MAACQGETVSKRGRRPPASPSEAMQGGEKEVTSQVWLTVHSFPPGWFLGLFWSEFQGPESCLSPGQTSAWGMVRISTWRSCRKPVLRVTAAPVRVSANSERQIPLPGVLWGGGWVGSDSQQKPQSILRESLKFPERKGNEANEQCHHLTNEDAY